MQKDLGDAENECECNVRGRKFGERYPFILSIEKSDFVQPSLAGCLTTSLIFDDNGILLMNSFALTGMWTSLMHAWTKKSAEKVGNDSPVLFLR